MNWILLVIAGLFEVAFAFCLGKAKFSTGVTSTYWLIGFLVALTLVWLCFTRLLKPYLLELLMLCGRELGP